MNCASCGRANREGARFCAGCGGSLAPRCPACGAAAEPDARFCDACGAAVAGRPGEPSVQRKVVTIVFADLIGSTALHERLDPESVRRIMEGYHGSVRVPVEAHGGTVVQLLGDGVMCAFGIPRVAEDDALRAVRAAVDVQRAFRDFVAAHPELSGRVGLRVAVNTGEVVVSDDYAAGIGDPLNVAARLQQEAHDGDVLIGGATQRFVADQVTLERVGSFALKGRTEPVATYRVASLEPPARASATPFVGRDHELRRLAAVYEAAIAAPAARLALLLGSPGLGKSRLLAEFASRLGDRATLLSAQCVASVGATFAPLADALRSALDGAPPGDPAERARVEAGIGALLAGTPAPPEETFFVVRRLLAALATKQPVVLVIDDLQWAEPLLLDLTEHLVQWGAGVPLLVIAAARPELRDVRSSLTSAGGVVSEVVTLVGLDAGAATQLAASLIGAEQLPAAIAGRVLATSEGNPLFLGELVRMLVNDGALKKEGERWTVGVELAALDMPPTIQALLAARIERLRAEDRLVLERASVIGRQFSRAAVAHLLPRESLADLDARLESLRRSELIEPDAGWLLGEPMLRFHHSLIRDAAYRRLLKNARAELHTRFAEWLEGQAGGSALYEETLGWHLEQAHQHLSEIGPLDASGRVLGERAARYLASAGRRALGRDDLPPAAGLLGRALARLDATDPARAELALDWCEALLSAGDVGPAVHALQELERFAEDSERLRAWHTCFSGQLSVLTDRQALHTSIEAVAAAAETLAAAGDAAGEAKAHWVHAIALSRLGQVGACEAALDRALGAARRVRADRRRANAVLSGAPLAALWGPSPVTRASGRCLDVVRVLRITQGAPAVEAVALRCQAVLETLRGRGDAARRMLASSRSMVEELGITQRLLEADLFAGLIELLEGDAAGAERWLRSAYEGLRARGLGIDAAQAAALLGRALLAQDRAAEAEALSHESEALAGDDLKAAIAWRGVRAEALARRGEPQAAIDLARQAVEIAATTDALLDHADARKALAAALRAAGQSAEAEAEEQRAVELWEAKGATLLAERARRAVGHVARADPAPDFRARPAGRRRRRVRANAATGNVARLQAMIMARNGAALETLLAADFESIHHPTGSISDGTVDLAVFRELLRAYDPHLEIEDLATLGHSLALCRQVRSFSALANAEGIDVGPTHSEQLLLVETDAREQAKRVEMWEPKRLGDAVAHLYQRYAELLPVGSERTRAATTTRAVATLLGPPNLAAWGAVFAPHVEFIDTRSVGFGSIRGADAVLDGIRALFELSSEFATRIEDVLCAEPGALLVRWTNSGTLLASGGEFERDLCHVWLFGADGRLVRWEQFDAERADEALARFDALTAAPPAQPIENAATRWADRFNGAWATGDWERIAVLYPPCFCQFDRRKLVQLELDREEHHQRLRAFLEMSRSRCTAGVIATRGDRLALVRMEWEGSDHSAGPSEIEFAAILEMSGDDALETMVQFDLDDLDAAYAELDERYAAGEAAAHPRVFAATEAFRSAFAARAWEAITEQYVPDVIAHDHRLLGWEPIRGAPAYVESLRTLVELAPDVQIRSDHIAMNERGLFWVGRWSGTREGGPFDSPWIVVSEHDASGRVLRFDTYDLEQKAAARARFAELAHDPLRIPPNAATRFDERLRAVIEAHDGEGVAALIAEDATFEDRRRGFRLAGDRDLLLENIRYLGSRGVRSTATPLATAGDRLALQRFQYTGPAGTAPIEVENLQVTELDAEGRLRACVVFDLDARRAASDEMFVRLRRGEGGHVSQSFIEFVLAMNAHDRERARALLPDDFVFDDQRRTRVGRLGNADDYVASLAALWEMSGDASTETLYYVDFAEHGSLNVGRMFGTLSDGGEFESLFVRLGRFRDGQFVGAELFELENLDLARARFEELRPDPLRIPPNSASRASDRVAEAFLARDPAALRALASADFRFEDRRRRALLSGDVELWIQNFEVIRSWPGLRTRRELIGTIGERIALERLVFAGDPGGSAFDGEFLRLAESDAAGRVRSVIHFDPEDRGAAFAEAQARFAAGEAAGSEAQAAITAFSGSFRQRDWAACHGCYTGDAVMQDHRRLGFGSVSIDGWIESWRVLVELAPDVSAEQFRILAWSERGRVAVMRQHGTREGGPFESVFVGVFLTRGDHIERYEIFDPADSDRALARFAELSAG